MRLTTLKNAGKGTKAIAPVSKTIVAMGVLLLSAQPMFAQKGLDVSLKCNIQTSSLINKSDQEAGPEVDFKNNTSAAFGLAVGYAFDKHMGAEIGFLYSKQGQGYKGDVSRIAVGQPVPPDLSINFRSLAQWNQMSGFTGMYTAQRELTCIKIPILFRYTGDNTKKIYFSSFIGPQINMISSATFKVNGQTVLAPGMSTISAYKKTGIDAVLGVGATMNITKNIGVSVQLRLDYGLGDAEDKNATYTTSNGPAKFYQTGRASTHQATGGGLITFTYKFIKKVKEAIKGKPGTKKPAAKPAAKKAPAKKAPAKKPAAKKK